MPPEWVRTQIPFVASVNALFAELDAKAYGSSEAVFAHVEGLHVAPSVIVHSGGGLHLYWLFDQPVVLADETARDQWAGVQADWVLWMGGDQGAKDLARVLRIPGTVNAKYTPGRRVEVIDANWTLYDSEMLLTMCALGVAKAKAAARLLMVGADEVIEPRRPARREGDGIIDRFNTQHSPAEIMQRHGYTIGKNGNRFTRPGKKVADGISGTINDGAGKETVYTFSSNDPLFDADQAHRLDAFDVFVKLDHGGDMQAALAAAAAEQGRRYTPRAGGLCNVG
jgi:hypothetical protein